jgi:ribosomal protein S18 acetylase RimI-like enzyme
VRIEEAAQATPELVEAFARLVPQLSRSSPPPDAAALQALIAHQGTTVFMARSSARSSAPASGTATDTAVSYIGTLTLVVFSIPTGVRAWIEDVIVDAAARGQGVGEALTRRAVEKAKAQGAKTVDLTSRPSRESANRLYQRIGFERRDTNVYRYVIEP